MPTDPPKKDVRKSGVLKPRITSAAKIMEKAQPPLLIRLHLLADHLEQSVNEILKK